MIDPNKIAGYNEVVIKSWQYLCPELRLLLQ